jgi:hypothetical protein
MATLISETIDRIACDGFAILPKVFSEKEIDAIVPELTQALQTLAGSSTMHTETGQVYAARNILSLWPPAATVWRRTMLCEKLADVLGPSFGLVRTLYFDKPPERTWALPWHKDLTIAVRDNRLPSQLFCKPTRKASVPHVEAPVEVLEQMLFARIHLDDVTEENGPLLVVPGSHHSGKELALGTVPPCSILVERGDVLLIRPLVAHASGKSHPETHRHRRILHLEFAASEALPDGYAWHDFLPA